MKNLKVSSAKEIRVPDGMDSAMYFEFKNWWDNNFPDGFPVDELYFMECWTAAKEDELNR